MSLAQLALHLAVSTRLAVFVAGLAAVNLWMTLFAAVSLLAPLRVGGLVSMGRYTAVIFPMFLAYATLNRHIVIAWAIVFWRVAVVVRGIVFADRAVF